MDWIRRNWLDLLIGFAFLAVISGIIITLFSGGSLFPGRGNNNMDTNDTTTLAGNINPVDNSSGVIATAPSSTAQGVQSIAANSTTSFTPPTVTTNTVASTTTAEVDGTTGIGIPMMGANLDNDSAVEPASITVTTLSPANTTSTNANAQTSVRNSGTTTPVSITTSQASAPFNVNATTATTQNSVTPRTTSTIVSSADRNALLSSALSVPVNTSGVNRVSVGAFSNANNANALANQLRAQGLVAETQPSGNLTLVYVGPYSNGAQAQQVASQLKAAGIVADTQVYTRFAAASTSSSSTPTRTNATSIVNQPVASQPVVSQPVVNQPVVSQPVVNQPVILAPNTTTTTTTVTAGPPLATNGRYLQVGAYRDRATAAPQRQRLESLGYVVFDRVESNLVKLVVGPYRSDELVNVQSVLRAQGVDSFPTR